MLTVLYVILTVIVSLYVLAGVAWVFMSIADWFHMLERKEQAWRKQKIDSAE